METSISNRYEFVLFVDVKDGNPNGDPDAGNMPRIDAETGQGLITDVCIKRKIRNYVQLAKAGEEGFDIFIKQGTILNNTIHQAFEENGETKDKKANKKVQAWMCGHYYDIRTFGAVLSTGDNAGQVRGPIQMTFGRSVDPIVASEHCITRLAVTDEKDANNANTMGRKSTVPYALYQFNGFISANFAKKTGFGEADLALFWEAVKGMFDDDHSAARGLMAVRKLIVFKHSSALGSVRAAQLIDSVHVERTNAEDGPARCFGDYKITVDKTPDNVELIEMV